ncbi:uncharacterized protein LOC136086774 isoform X1 [Hydra vulgaris]|uniref:Uncharacterized protein LOC136086774 isoform X1 n=1 Tax=Hydra vulgaris TaxID=6087 RepID=A0ABM4CTS1_HYDVU
MATSGPYAQVIWLEGNQEMERTIPINWIDEDTNKVFWPNTLNVKNAFKRCQQPKKDWLKFEFVKIKVCGSEQFCDDCIDYTTTEEQICKRKSQKKSMKSPILSNFLSKQIYVYNKLCFK